MIASSKDPPMTYAAVLVHVPVDPAAEPRLRLAADLANQFGATLIGVGAEMFETPAPADALGYVDATAAVSEAKLIGEDLHQAEATFRAVGAGVQTGAEWRADVGIPCDIICAQARAADLIVAGPRHPDPWGYRGHADPGDLLMHAGRPILITPQGLDHLDASSIVVAWKDTRESRRALSDALPFLKRAMTVLIAEICEKGDDEAAKARVTDVSNYLARHGVEATTVVRAPTTSGAGADLLELAERQKAGLIVAGGYGHSRAREWAFGGVTQVLLAGARRPVLLCH